MQGNSGPHWQRPLVRPGKVSVYPDMFGMSNFITSNYDTKMINPNMILILFDLLRVFGAGESTGVMIVIFVRL